MALTDYCVYLANTHAYTTHVKVNAYVTRYAKVTCV